MRTYKAGKDPVDVWGGDTRAWVFDLLENPDHRRRLEALAALDLKRRAGCEPCLRALVTDDWDYEAVHHLGWCESCRAASLALGMDTASKKPVGYPHKRALVVALIAVAAIAAPLAGSRLIDRGDGGGSGGVAVQTTPNTTPATTPGTTPTTTPGTTPSTTPGTTPTTTPGTTPTTTEPATTTPVIKPVPRTRPTAGVKGRGKQALPLTT